MTYDYDTRSQEGYDEDVDPDVWAAEPNYEGAPTLIAEDTDTLDELVGGDVSLGQCRDCGGDVDSDHAFTIEKRESGRYVVVCYVCKRVYPVFGHPASKTIF